MARKKIKAALDRLMSAVEALPGEWPLSGGVITVATRAGIADIRPFGVTSPRGAVPVDENHLFEIGSISKVFNGLLILALTDDGLCDLDAPVSRYLPWFDVGSDYGPITVRTLLHHTSGLIKGADDPPDALAQCQLLSETRTGSPPGTVFNYSNVGYMLLGQIISRLSGQSPADYCRTKLLEPLGMTSTLARLRNADRAHLAVGSCPDADDRPWLPGDPLAPATWFEVDATDGNIASSGTDMGYFLHYLLGRGQVEGRAISSPQAFDRLIGDLAVSGEDWTDGFGAKPVETSRYGLGINVETIDGRLCLTHGGGMVGYSSFVLADLDADCAISVLTNANGDYPIGQVIARLGHALLVDTTAKIPSLDLRLTPEGFGYKPAMLGRFQAIDDTGDVRSIRVEPRDGALSIIGDDATGRLFRSWTERFVSDHPAYRRFHLGFEDGGDGAAWTYGPHIFRPENAIPTQDGGSSASPRHLSRHVGRYRSFCAWYPTFRIVLRGNRLLLIAPGGVESPSSDTELVELEGGAFRIGSETWRPERLVFGPAIDGQTTWASRDGCRYSRTAMD